jgi:hypothetical protein
MMLIGYRCLIGAITPLRLLNLIGARNEILLTATGQNLKMVANHTTTPPSATALLVQIGAGTRCHLDVAQH